MDDKLKTRFNISVTVILFLIGLNWFFQLPISLYPTISKPSIQLSFYYDQDVHSFYQEWGNKIERSLRDMDGATEVDGTYKNGQVKYVIQFDWYIKPEIAKKEAARFGAMYQAQLPKHLPSYKVAYYDPTSESYLAIKANKYEVDQLAKILQQTLEPQLKAIKGVSRTMIAGGSTEMVNIQINPFALIENNVKLQDVLSALRQYRYDEAVGVLESSSEGKVNIRLTQGISNLADIRAVPITANPGKPLLLAEVAEIQLIKEQGNRLFQYDDISVVVIGVWPEPDANQYWLAKQVKEVIEVTAGPLGDVFSLNDPQEFVDAAILNIVVSLFVGMFSAAFVVLVVYRRFSTSLLIVVTMPITLSISIIAMQILGVGINILSLGAMGISIGMVVDNAIVIIDRITHSQNKALTSEKEIIEAVRSVKPSLISSTLTSIIVFLPLVFSAPMISAILRDMALVIVSILCVSLFISLYFLPAIFLAFAKKRHFSPKKPSVRFEQVMSQFLSNKTLKTSVLVLVIFYILYVLMRIPTLIEREVIAQPKAEIVDIFMPFTASGLSNSDKLAALAPIKSALRDELGQHIKYIYSDIRDEYAYLTVHLVSYRNFDAFYGSLKHVLSAFGEDVTYSPWITGALKIEDHPDLTLYFNHDNEHINRDLLKKSYQWVKDRPSTYRSDVTPRLFKNNELELNLRNNLVDRLLVGQNYNSEIADLTEYLKFTASPFTLYKIKLDEGFFPLKVSISNNKSSVEAILQTPVQFAGKNVFLQDVTTLSAVETAKEFASRDGRAMFRLKIWFDKAVQVDNQKFIAALESMLKTEFDQDVLPMRVENSKTEVEQSLQSLKTTLVFSILMVFIIVLYQFGTMRSALMICTAILFGITGAIHAIYLFDSTLSLNSMLGMLILIGLTVNNSILLLDFFNRNSAQGMMTVLAVIDALRNRFRSLVVTNLTTIVAMLPLAIGYGAGKEILKPLGISITVGLFIATTLTIVVLPILMSFMAPKVSTVFSET